MKNITKKTKKLITSPAEGVKSDGAWVYEKIEGTPCLTKIIGEQDLADIGLLAYTDDEDEVMTLMPETVNEMKSIIGVDVFDDESPIATAEFIIGELTIIIINVSLQQARAFEERFSDEGVKVHDVPDAENVVALFPG